MLSSGSSADYSPLKLSYDYLFLGAPWSSAMLMPLGVINTERNRLQRFKGIFLRVESMQAANRDRGVSILLQGSSNSATPCEFPRAYGSSDQLMRPLYCALRNDTLETDDREWKPILSTAEGIENRHPPSSNFNPRRQLILPRRFECFVYHLDDRLHLDPFRFAGVEIFDAVEPAIQIRHIVFGNIGP